MINLTLKIKPAEVKEYAVLIKTGISALQGDEYVHYYNLRHLLKKFFDKQFTINHSRAAVSIRVNINEYESLKYISPVVEAHPYYNALYISAVEQLEKQVNNARYLPNW